MGGEKDSLGYLKKLVPQRPKVDEFKALDNDKKILRFTARFNTRTPEDVDRRFIISFYLGDDTIGIYEPNQKNSGIVPGKFDDLQMQVPNPRVTSQIFCLPAASCIVD